MQHVARCTRLRELTVPCTTAEELALAAPALQQLRMLDLNDPQPLAADGDAVMEALLALPHLTRLGWHHPSHHTFKRWYNDRPCRWEELHVGVVSPHQLARLPLRSLKQPVKWERLGVAGNEPLHEVRAAVANVTCGCPAGVRWGRSEGAAPWLALLGPLGGAEDVPGVLRALRPLLATPSRFSLSHARLDVAGVEALGEVLPRTCTHLGLYERGAVPRGALEQVARSLPWLRSLHLVEQEVAPEDVVAYVRMEREEGEGLMRLVEVEHPVRPEGVGDAEHKQAWERAERAVEQAGGGAVVLLRVVVMSLWGTH